MKKSLQIENDAVNSLLQLSATIKTMEEITTNLLETHLLDDKQEAEAVLNSPLFIDFINKIGIISMQYQKLQSDILFKYINKKDLNRIKHWKINYITGILLYEY